MSITVLLAYAVYLTIIADNMPQTSLQVSYLAVYLTLLLGLTAMGVVLSVIVLHIHHKTNDCRLGRRSELVIRKLRRILGINRAEGGEEEETANRATPKQKDSEKNLNGHHGNSFSPHGLRSKAAVTPLQNNAAVSPPPSYKERKEELSWPKVAETVDRVLFISTSFLIALITIIFLSLLASES
ncbi:neuronal acetylcholine receptor subunit alpha-3 [Plakobranchus ocellatus]|uniref:Neuronal acetylcholine receptor subunit alpha-3 n=1 Tax=Plakobranchus ocellatus TaxID=259542 RepID=A0AAV3ZDU1_9GAST|nr:neuronal acetylcholine receptor subunit alpha-3 [Plakobranchus ocellatus]